MNIRASLTEYRIKLQRAGFKPIPVGGKTPRINSWQNKINVSPDEIASWSNWPSTGLLTQLMPTLDADIMKPEAAEAVEALARNRFEGHGRIAVRIGNSPKRAILFRTNTPFKKIVVNLDAPDGSAGQKIEFLGDGQQVVIAGIHPDTGKPYRWTDLQPGQFNHADLPNITETEAAALIDEAAELLCRHHGYRRATAKPGNGDASEDWSFLFDNIRNGRELHDSIRDLAAKLVRSGMHGGGATNILRAEMMLSAARQGRLQEWRARYNDIPRAVHTAEEKFVDPEQSTAAPELRSFFAEELEQHPIKPVPWIVKDFIPGGTVTGLFGDGGTGKDLLLFMLGTAASCGERWLGREVKPCRVMYFPVEDDEDELRRRQAAIAAHYAIHFAEFPGRFLITPLVGKDTVLASFDPKSGVVKPTELYFATRKLIEDFKPDLVIVANRVNIFSVNQNDDAMARQCMQLLFSIAIDCQTAVIMPGHVSQSGLNSNSGTSGSVQWSNACRSRLFLSRILEPKEKEELDPDARLLEVKKANWASTNRRISLCWSSGVFVEDNGVVWMPEQAQAKLEDEKEFLRMLDLKVENVSPHQTSKNYAPKIFSDDPRCKRRARAGKKQLAEAMVRLVTRGVIGIAPYGPPSRVREKLVRILSNSSAEGDAA